MTGESRTASGIWPSPEGKYAPLFSGRSIKNTIADKVWNRRGLYIAVSAAVAAVVCVLGVHWLRGGPPERPWTSWDLDFSNARPIVDVRIQTCATEQGCPIKEFRQLPKNLHILSDDADSKFAYLYYKYGKIGTTGEVLVDVAVESSSPGDGWTQVGDSTLWAKYGTSDAGSAVTAIDILFGDGAADPRVNWRLLDSKLQVGDAYTEARVSVRTGEPVAPEVPVLRQNSDGRLRILQVADMHFSTGKGDCRNPYPPTYGGPDCRADELSLAFINKTLDDIQPDLAVLTGDNAHGPTAPDQETAYLKLLALFVARKQPFALVFGNHDDEGPLDRHALMALVQSVPYAMAVPGPESAEGVGNYVIEALSDNHNHPPINIWFLDSHAYVDEEQQHEDWIRPGQLQFIADEGARRRQTYGNTQPLAMSFQHIPLPEYRHYKTANYLGLYQEGPGAPTHNSGARDALVAQGVRAVSVGHDHLNDYCLLDTSPAGSIYLCYGGVGGVGGYGGHGFIRRMRIYDLDSSTNSISTFKVRRDGGPSYTQVLYDGGEFVPPPE